MSNSSVPAARLFGQRAWDVTEGVVRDIWRVGEGGGVEPLILGAVGEDGAHTRCEVWTGRVRVIAIATNRQGKACLEDGDGVDLVATDQSIDKSVAGTKATPFAER